MSEWENIWNKHEGDLKVLADADDKTKFLELKRANGFDVIGHGLSYDSLIQQYNEIKEMLINKSFIPQIGGACSVYEIGCGSGANLFLFEKEGYKVGGIDYSQSLINTAKNVLDSVDLICDSAVNMPAFPQYDVVLSNSVFSYFDDEDYAAQVLEKAFKKAVYAIGLIDIHDIEKKDKFIEFRRKEVENYEERYKNLPKYFYSRKFFEDFAKRKDMEIVFTEPIVDGYWNNGFIFDCFMYKRG